LALATAVGFLALGKASLCLALIAHRPRRWHAWDQEAFLIPRDNLDNSAIESARGSAMWVADDGGGGMWPAPRQRICEVVNPMQE
jgi:cbb3-type cytochrome oxidase subunit 3